MPRKFLPSKPFRIEQYICAPIERIQIFVCLRANGSETKMASPRDRLVWLSLQPSFGLYFHASISHLTRCSQYAACSQQIGSWNAPTCVSYRTGTVYGCPGPATDVKSICLAPGSETHNPLRRLDIRRDHRSLFESIISGKGAACLSDFKADCST